MIQWQRMWEMGEDLMGNDGWGGQKGDVSGKAYMCFRRLKSHTFYNYFYTDRQWFVTTLFCPSSSSQLRLSPSAGVKSGTAGALRPQPPVCPQQPTTASGAIWINSARPFITALSSFDWKWAVSHLEWGLNVLNPHRLAQRQGAREDAAGWACCHWGEDWAWRGVFERGPPPSVKVLELVGQMTTNWLHQLLAHCRPLSPEGRAGVRGGGGSGRTAIDGVGGCHLNPSREVLSLSSV